MAMGEYSPWSIIGKPTEIVVDIDELRVTEGERVYITIVDGKLAPSSLESSNCNITIELQYNNSAFRSDRSNAR